MPADLSIETLSALGGAIVTLGGLFLYVRRWFTKELSDHNALQDKAIKQSAEERALMLNLILDMSELLIKNGANGDAHRLKDRVTELMVDKAGQVLI